MERAGFLSKMHNFCPVPCVFLEQTKAFSFVSRAFVKGHFVIVKAYTFLHLIHSDLLIHMQITFVANVFDHQKMVGVDYGSNIIRGNKRNSEIFLSLLLSSKNILFDVETGTLRKAYEKVKVIGKTHINPL